MSDLRAACIHGRYDEHRVSNSWPCLGGQEITRLPGIIFGSPAPWLVETVRDAWTGAPQGMTRPDLIVVVAEAVGVRLDAVVGDPG